MSDKDAQQSWIVRVLGINPGRDAELADAVLFLPEDEGEPPKGIIASRKAILEYRLARASIQAQLAALAATIDASLPAESETSRQLARTIDQMCDSLDDTVDQSINALSGDRSVKNAAVRKDI